VPAAAIAALANAGAAYVAVASQGAWRAGFAVVMSGLLGLGAWHTGHAVSEWYGPSYAIAKEREALMAKAEISGCLLTPYYDATSTEFSLYFGKQLAKGIYARQLTQLYPEFLTYNGTRFADFVDVLDPVQAEQRLSAKKCVYIFGSPVARFTGFGIPPSELMPIAQSQGGLGEALAIYQLSPKITGQSKPEAPQ
jgi:hypothetical protein